jgi:hypothetical protein
VNTPLQPTEVFYYKYKVAQGDSTSTLIDAVNFLDSAQLADIQAIEAMSGFVINITGTVVQGDLEGATAGEDLTGPTGPLINSDVESTLMTQLQAITIPQY